MNKNNLDCLVETVIAEYKADKLRKDAIDRSTNENNRYGYHEQAKASMQYNELNEKHQETIAKLAWFIAEIQRGRHDLPPQESVTEEVETNSKVVSVLKSVDDALSHAVTVR